MNRLQYIIKAKTQYDIQSPFMFDLYEKVLSPRLDSSMQALVDSDRFEQLLYKLTDHYRAYECKTATTLQGADRVLQCFDNSLIGLVRSPHRSKDSEEAWKRLFKEPDVTLSVDLYDIGLVFTSKRLSKQHILFREL